MAEKLSVTDVDVDSALRLLEDHDEPIATWSRTTSTAVCVTRLRRRWGQERYEQQAQFDLLTYEAAFARGGGAEALRAAETISERLTGRTSRPELDEELALLLPQSYHERKGFSTKLVNQVGTQARPRAPCMLGRARARAMQTPSARRYAVRARLVIPGSAHAHAQCKRPLPVG